MLDLIAGAIFNDQEIFTFSLIAFIVVSLLTGTLVFVGKRILNKLNVIKTRPISFTMAILVGFGIMTALILFFFVIPTRIKDRNWENKQQNCAKAAGYNSPADDNSGSASSDQQSDYRGCLLR